MKVSVEIDPRWVKLTRSPLCHVVSALAGVAISFAPLFLYWAGQGKFYPAYEWLVVPLCFAIIYLVPLFYFRLGFPVAKELRQNSQLANE
jgi:hypothetical protein